MPLLALALLGLLARVPILSIGSLRLDLAIALIFIASFYFVLRDWRFGLSLFGVSIIFYVAGAALPLPADVILLIAGLSERLLQLRLARH